MFIEYSKREINLKVAYYGPGLGGKTTCMQHVYQKTAPERRNQMISLATETERTLFFDFLPLSLGTISGFHYRLHLHTVPGPVFYDSSRIAILSGVDGIVFVADSQSARMEANVQSLEELESNLAVHGHDIGKVPMVLQYNKRDLPDISSMADMDAILNPAGRKRFESVAVQGLGVFEALKAVSRLMLRTLSK